MPTRTWSDAELDAFRQQTDPDADAVVADLEARNAITAVDTAWRAMRKSDDPVPAGLPASLETYLKTPSPALAAADRARIERGERFFAAHGAEVCVGLLCASLPTAYSCAHGAEVLGLTGRMVDDVRMRIDETAQLVFDVARPGGMTPTGRGACTTHKVRLIHATIRHLARAKQWDAARNGEPINQEDLAGTMLTFGHVTARAVHKLGGDVAGADWDAWIYLWGIVGQTLGLDPALVPHDREEAETLLQTILRRQQAPSAVGRDLTRALVTHIDEYVPGKGFDGITAELMRYFVGDRAADWLGVPRDNWTGVLLWLERQWARHFGPTPFHDRLLRRIAGRLQIGVLQAMDALDRRGKDVRFNLPPSLASRSWRL